MLGRPAVPQGLGELKQRGRSFFRQYSESGGIPSQGMLAGRWLDFAVREVCLCVEITSHAESDLVAAESLVT